MYITENVKRIAMLTGMFILVVLGGLFITEKSIFAPSEPALAVESEVPPPDETTPDSVEPQSKFNCNGMVILFDKNKTTQLVVTPVEQNCFNNFAEQIRKGVYNTIYLTGRSSCDSSLEHGLKLSQERTDIVKQSLVNAGIDSSKIMATGIGFTQPLGDCYSTDGINRNRSVTIGGK